MMQMQCNIEDYLIVDVTESVLRQQNVFLISSVYIIIAVLMV